MDPSSYIKGEEANLYSFSVSNILWKYTDLPPHPLHQVLTLWLPSHEKFKEKNKVWSETNVSFVSNSNNSSMYLVPSHNSAL